MSVFQIIACLVFFVIVCVCFKILYVEISVNTKYKDYPTILFNFVLIILFSGLIGTMVYNGFMN